MGKNIFEILKDKDIGSIGIGAMIVFIAMVLVAGIAASVLIQTSTSLESQAMTTGRETTKEVSSGLSVVNIGGYNTSGNVIYLAICVRARAGSADIDLAETIIEISNSTVKNLLVYDKTGAPVYTAKDDIDGDIFTAAFYPVDATHFSVIVLEDADNSCSAADTVVINSGDYVVLGVETDQCFNGLEPRDNVWGMVVPEIGSPGVISFKCPASYTEAVLELQ